MSRTPDRQDIVVVHSSDIHVDSGVEDGTLGLRLVTETARALAADVLYEERNVEPLLELLPQLAREVWLAEPGRPHAAAFFDRARKQWHVAEHADRVFLLTRMR